MGIHPCPSLILVKSPTLVFHSISILFTMKSAPVIAAFVGSSTALTCAVSTTVVCPTNGLLGCYLSTVTPTGCVVPPTTTPLPVSTSVTGEWDDWTTSTTTKKATTTTSATGEWDDWTSTTTASTKKATTTSATGEWNDWTTITSEDPETSSWADWSSKPVTKTLTRSGSIITVTGTASWDDWSSTLVTKTLTQTGSMSTVTGWGAPTASTPVAGMSTVTGGEWTSPASPAGSTVGTSTGVAPAVWTGAATMPKAELSLMALVGLAFAL